MTQTASSRSLRKKKTVDKRGLFNKSACLLHKLRTVLCTFCLKKCSSQQASKNSQIFNNKCLRHGVLYLFLLFLFLLFIILLSVSFCLLLSSFSKVKFYPSASPAPSLNYTMCVCVCVCGCVCVGGCVSGCLIEFLTFSLLFFHFRCSRCPVLYVLLLLLMLYLSIAFCHNI